MSFKGIREYNQNDDFRTIDWSATAKMQRPFVKENEADRNLNILFAIDVSKSLDSIFDSSKEKNKREIICEISSLMSYANNQNNDRTGVVFFSDVIECSYGLSNRKDVPSILSHILLNYTPMSAGSDFSICLKYIIDVFPKNTVVIIFSDFLFKDDFEKTLKIAAKKFKLIGIELECEFTNNEEISDGIYRIYDKEIGKEIIVDITKKSLDAIRKKQQEKKTLLKKYF